MISVQERYEISDAFAKSCRLLKPKWVRVLKLRYGLYGGPSLTRAEIANEFGLSAARIAQIERKALGVLRRPSASKLFGRVCRKANAVRRDPMPCASLADRALAFFVAAQASSANAQTDNNPLWDSADRLFRSDEWRKSDPAQRAKLYRELKRTAEVA